MIQKLEGMRVVISIQQILVLKGRRVVQVSRVVCLLLLVHCCSQGWMVQNVQEIMLARALVNERT